MTIRSTFVVIAFFSVILFAAPHAVQAAVQCPGGPVPDGWDCPPTTPPANSNATSRDGVNNDGWLQTYMACPKTATNCSSGWQPNLCSSGMITVCHPVDGAIDQGVAVVKDLNSTGQAVAGVFAPCQDPKLSTVDTAACYIGAPVVAAIDKLTSTIFSLKNLYWIGSVIAYWIFMLAKLFLGWAIWWLDGAIYFTVVLMGFYIGDPAAQAGIRVSWVLIRDFANIMIIAGFIAVGISTILNISQYAADKFLARLIIAALLVNFSYFIAGAIIDASNYVAVQIYYSDFLKDGCPQTTQKGSVRSPIGAANALGQGLAKGDIPGSLCSVGNSFLKYTNITSWDDLRYAALVSAGVSGATKTTTEDQAVAALDAAKAPQKSYRDLYWQLMMMAIMGALFAGVTAYVFVSAAMILIIRFAALIMVLITSPLGIAGVNVPYISNIVGRWWTVLASQAVIAPVFIFMAAIALRVTQSLVTFLHTSGLTYAKAAEALQNQAGFGILTGDLALFMVFFIGLAFMYIALVVTKQVAAATPELKGVYDAAQGYAWSTLLAPKRQVFDRLTGSVARPLWDAAVTAGTREGTTARSIGVGVSGALRSLQRLGDGKKHEKSGAEEAREEIDKNARDRAAGKERARMEGGFMAQSILGPMTGLLRKNIADLTEDQKKDVSGYLHSEKYDDLVARHGQEQVNSWAQAGLLDKGHLKAANEKGRNAAFNAAYLAGKGVTKDTAGKDAAEIFEDLDEVEREILLVERAELRTNKEFLTNLKSKTFDEVIKGESPQTKTTLRDARADGLKTQLKSTDPKVVQGALKRMSDPEKAGLDPDTVAASVDHMTAAERNHIHRNTRNKKVKEVIEAKYREELSGTGPGRNSNPDEEEGAAPAEIK